MDILDRLPDLNKLNETFPNIKYNSYEYLYLNNDKSHKLQFGNNTRRIYKRYELDLHKLYEFINELKTYITNIISVLTTLGNIWSTNKSETNEFIKNNIDNTLLLMVEGNEKKLKFYLDINPLKSYDFLENYRVIALPHNF